MALIPRCRGLGIVVSALVMSIFLCPAGAYDPLDPYGAVHVKWDVMSWDPQGYTATVSMYNTQQFRGLKSYVLAWQWGKKEIIESMMGARATDQGDCSKFPSPPPHSCRPDPTIIDLSPGVPYSQQVANCCRDGVISAFAQDPVNSVSSFSISVGNSANTNTSVVIPRKLSLRSPGPGYTCSELQKVPSTRFTTDGKRFTQAYLTWNATCTYSQYLAQKAPTCCVALSAFYSDKITKCSDCACTCSPNIGTGTASGVHRIPGSDQTCLDPDTSFKNPLVTGALTSPTIVRPQLYCTNDMCPVKIHWHIKDNYKEYWRVKVTITNRNLTQNYTNWNMVAQHPNFVNFTTAFSFTHKALTPFGAVVNDTAMFSGVRYYNEMLLRAGPEGNVQSELLFAKDSDFTLKQGWGFPTRIYFNGDECVLPDPQSFPALPSGSITLQIGLSSMLGLLSSIALFFTTSL